MDHQVSSSGYGISSSHRRSEPSDSTGCRYDKGTRENKETHVDSGRIKKTGQSTQFSGHSCSIRPSATSRISGYTVSNAQICQNPGPRRAPESFASRYPIRSNESVVARLSSPRNQASGAHLSADALKTLGQVCLEVFEKVIIKDLLFMKNITEQEVQNALLNLRSPRTVLRNLRGLSADSAVTDEQKWAMNEVARSHELLNADQTPHSETGLAVETGKTIKVSESVVNADDPWLGLRDDDLTPSLRWDIERGKAGGNQASHFRKPAGLLAKIARNLGFYRDLNDATRTDIVNRITSSGPDRNIIIKAAGHLMKPETQEALESLQAWYTGLELSLSPSPAVEAGQGSVSAAVSSNADRPEISVHEFNASKHAIHAIEVAGDRQSIDPGSSDEDEGNFIREADILDAMADIVAKDRCVSSSQSSGHSSPWEFVGVEGELESRVESDENVGFEGVVDTESHAPDTHHKQIHEEAVWATLGVKDPTLSLMISVKRAIEQGAIAESALAPDQGSDSSGYIKITEQQKRSLISSLETFYPDLDLTSRLMIRRHIGSVQLTLKQVNAAIDGGRDSITNILEKCQLRDSELLQKVPSERQYGGYLPNQRQSVSVFRSGPGQSGVLPDVIAAAVPAGEGIANSGKADAKVRHAGIQARDNNCGLASFFMSVSHDGLLDTLISDAENKIATHNYLSASDKTKTCELVSLLKKFNTGNNINAYISNDELDKIRLLYGLREVKLLSHVVGDAFKKAGQIVKFQVESEFHCNNDFRNETKAAEISLAISTGPVKESLHATVTSLPDRSSGYMRLNGNLLKVGQKLTQDELAELTFVPLGEVLEPTDFIHKILNEIYGYLNTEPMSLKQKVALVEMHSDCKQLNSSRYPSQNFDFLIKDEKVPDNLTLKKTKTNPNRFNRDVIGETIEYYHNENDILGLRLTKEHHYLHQHVTRKMFEYFDENGNNSGKIIIDMETHCQNGIPFVRVRESEYVDNNGERRKVEIKLTGYGKESPREGELIKTEIKRVDNFQEMIDIFIDSWKDQYGNFDSAKKALLPDENNYPEVIFMTMPNEGKNIRGRYDWQKDVGVPMYGSDKRIPYEVSAVMAIDKSHYVSWLRDSKNGLIHFADSMGDSENNVTIPVVVTMPDQDTEAALQLGDQRANDRHRHFKEAKRRLKVLENQVALVMLKRKQ